VEPRPVYLLLLRVKIHADPPAEPRISNYHKKQGLQHKEMLQPLLFRMLTRS
jgi:hypothetical protein